MRLVQTRSLLRSKPYRAAMSLAAIFLLANCFGGILSGSARHKYVTTEYGQVKGRIADDGDYFAFLGIPYAAPPVGELRFKGPQPSLPWNGVFDANRKVKCPQGDEGEEDCLILNVFTPTRPITEPLPVMMYIHGGSFIMGFGQSQGVEPLIKQNIIVVTINYRLGVLGFLCLGIEEAPGNAGLKDQIAALSWIQRNIANFGGDPTRVSIYGMSAGGASVEYLILSQSSRGLFRNAVIESASATPVWASDHDPITTAVNVAKYLNFSLDNDLQSLATQYRMTSARSLAKENFKYYTDVVDGSFGFVPCVEKPLEGVEAFLTKSPHELLATNDYHGVPVMFIFASLEGLYTRSAEYYEQNYKERMEANFVDFLPADLIFDSETHKSATAKRVKQFYFGNAPIDDDKIIGYLNYFGDNLILHGLLNSVGIHARNNNPVYLMEFAYKGSMGSNEQFYESIKLPGHGDAIKHAILIKPINNDADRMAVERMSTLAANFVKHSHPTVNTSDLIQVLWPPVHSTDKYAPYVSLNNNLEVLLELNGSFLERKLFWDDLYSKHRRKLRPVDPESYSGYKVKFTTAARVGTPDAA